VRHYVERIQKYIQYNPIKREEDRDNPSSPRFTTPAKSIDDYWAEMCYFPLDLVDKPKAARLLSAYLPTSPHIVPLTSRGLS
jgi:hypothetical protein